MAQDIGSRFGRAGLVLGILGILVLGAAGHAAAQDSAYAGWSGRYDDGCYYYWDSANWTGAKSCPQPEVTIVVPATSNTAQVATTVSTTGGDSVVFPSATITVPPPSNDCGDFCQPNFGQMLVDRLKQHPTMPAP